MIRMSNNIYTSLDYYCGSSKEEEVKEEERRRNCVSNPVSDSFFNGSDSRMNSRIMEGSAHKLCVRSAIEHDGSGGTPLPVSSLTTTDFFSENQVDIMENTTSPVPETGIQMYCPNPRCLKMQLWNGVDHKCAYCEGSQFTADSWKDHEDEKSEMSGATSTLDETTKTFELEMFPTKNWQESLTAVGTRGANEETEVDFSQSFVEGEAISQEMFESTPEFKESLENLEPFGWVDSQNSIARAIEQNIPVHKCPVEGQPLEVVAKMSEIDIASHNKAITVLGGLRIFEGKGKTNKGVVIMDQYDINGKMVPPACKEQVFGSDFELGLNYPTDYDTGKQLTNTRSVSYVTVNSVMEDMTDEHIIDFLYQCGAGCKRNHFHTRKTFETNNITPEYLVRRDLAIANSIAKAERVAKGDKQTPETREWVERYIEMNKEVINVEQFDLDILTESQCKALTWTLNRKSNPKGFSVEKALTSLVKTCPREVGI